MLEKIYGVYVVKFFFMVSVAACVELPDKAIANIVQHLAESKRNLKNLRLCDKKFRLAVDKAKVSLKICSSDLARFKDTDGAKFFNAIENLALRLYASSIGYFGLDHTANMILRLPHLKSLLLGFFFPLHSEIRVANIAHALGSREYLTCLELFFSTTHIFEDASVFAQNVRRLQNLEALTFGVDFSDQSQALVEAFSQVLPHMPSLKKFTLNIMMYHPTTGNPLGLLAESLMGMNFLEFFCLKLGNYTIRDTSFLLQSMANLINVKVLVLDFLNCKLRPEELEVVRDVLSNLLNIKSLTFLLQYYPKCHESFYSLYQAVASMVGLESLSLEVSGGYIESPEVLIHQVSLNHLTKLTMLSWEMPIRCGVSYLIFSIKHFQDLKVLVLNPHTVNLGIQGATCIADVFSYLPHLEALTLKMHSGYIQDEGMQAIVNNLRHILGVKTLVLELSDNYLGQSMIAFADYLPNMKSLVFLSLGLANNKMRDKEVSKLIKALKKLKKISFLNIDLRFNPFNQQIGRDFYFLNQELPCLQEESVFVF